MPNHAGPLLTLLVPFDFNEGTEAVIHAHAAKGLSKVEVAALAGVSLSTVKRALRKVA